MNEFTSIMAVAAILWTSFILYTGYLDSRVRAIEERLK